MYDSDYSEVGHHVPSSSGLQGQEHWNFPQGPETLQGNNDHHYDDLIVQVRNL